MIYFLFSPCFPTGRKYLYCRDPERGFLLFRSCFQRGHIFCCSLQRVTNKRASLYFLLSLGLYLKF